MKNEKILLVDDEIGILTLLEVTLKKEHYTHISRCTNAKQTIEMVRSHDYDLIILDVMLPDMNGFELCSLVRSHTNAPIIFISASSSDFDKLKGLSVGGDDYITKPFNPLEVVARMEALFRRQKMYQSQSYLVQENQEIRIGRLTLKPSDAMLVFDDQKIECTAKELDLLRFFLRNPNRIYTSSQIYELVWGGEPIYGEEKTVAMHISKIRKKLEVNPRSPEIIINIKGIGYKFVPPQ
ncbi:response regulator transcription factor [Paenibacillus polymyxa]|nr:response regulator transcription factor [Paenibacillus polymyxa]